jgi:guanylate kinase
MNAPRDPRPVRRATNARPLALALGRPLLVVISGPSGAGKTTLCNHLLAADQRLTRAVTCTTRPPRGGEQNGVDYHFLTAEAFEQGVAAGAFLEHATVHGNRYGTWKREVLRRFRDGRSVLLNVDVQGAAAIRAAARSIPRLSGALITVFLAPPTLRELERRLRRRNSETPAMRRRRLAVAHAEMAERPKFDYFLPSATPAEDLRRMQAILEAEGMRPVRRRPGTEGQSWVTNAR